MARKILDATGQVYNDALNVATARQMMMCRSKRYQRAFANDFSALNPTIWAQEAIVQLLPNMVLANLVARDFDNEVSRFGDIVNAFIPGTFEMTRKGALCENVVVQDASGSTLQVPLDQWPQVSFLICDGEENRNALDLVDTLLTPAVIAMAQGVDRILTMQVYQFLTNVAGHAGNMDATNVAAYILEARETMNRNNVPLPGRVLMLGPGSETEALSVPQFTFANESGEGPSAIREAQLGRKYGFDIYMAQNMAEVSSGQSTVGVVTTNAAAGAGSTALPVTGAGVANILAGQWALVAGDDTPQQITAVNAGTLTLWPGLKRAVANGAAVTIIASGTVQAGNNYPGSSLHPRKIGWAKEILVQGFPGSLPQIGQMVTFGTDPIKYAIIKLRIIDANAGTAGITLDRPLANAVGAGETVNLGPAAHYNFGFLRNAFTLVNRPLPQPRAGTGAISRVLVDPVNKISLRVTITYDGEKQGHLVTIDTLMGVGVLSELMGVVLLG